MRVHGLPRGITHHLYNAAREYYGRPLGLLAAEGLMNTVSKGDRVIIATGAGHEIWLPKGESDGPIGAAAIARALAKGLGALPVLVGEAAYMEPLVASCTAAGLVIMNFERAQQRTMAGTTFAYPLGEQEGREAAQEVLNTFRPKALIAIEKLGANAKGIQHSVLGRPTAGLAQVHHLFNLAHEKDLYAVGVGDGGNEIGFGHISEDVRRIMPYGRTCQCPCGAGNADVTVTDVTVVGTASNWGAYNIAANLAFLLKDPEVLHSPETEMRMVQACALGGGGDGVYETTEPIVDGMSLEVQAAVITILQEMVRNGLKEVPRAF